MKTTLRPVVVILATLTCVSPCFSQPSDIPPAVLENAKGFKVGELKSHVSFLADDLLEGRAPGSRGEQVAMRYISSRFQAAGLEPAGDGGTYYQKVPLVGRTLLPDQTRISFVAKSGAFEPKYLTEFVGATAIEAEKVSADAELVFVGHGVFAPEYRWDDYKGADVRGKTLVMLVDDPPASSAEPRLFDGKGRTYYGRWSYKYEEATRRGAAAVILLHTDESAGYGWAVVRNSWAREKASMKLEQGQHALSFEGWLTEEASRKLLALAGMDLESLRAKAASRKFRPIPLDVRLTADVVSRVRTIDTSNIIGKVEGADPQLAREAVLYSAHHDHLGIGEPKSGDAIYNGAIDNATGLAVLLELARVWGTGAVKPARTIYFVSIAAEEQGLLGSAYLGSHPPVPAGRIALDINFDMIYPFGRARNVLLNGVDRTTFSLVAERIALLSGLRLTTDDEPEQGHYFRSDHFSLARVGIPSFSVTPGMDLVDKPSGEGLAEKVAYRKNDYHQPSDEMRKDWNYDGTLQILELGYLLGFEAARVTPIPSWKKGDEYLKVREASAKQ